MIHYHHFRIYRASKNRNKTDNEFDYYRKYNMTFCFELPDYAELMDKVVFHCTNPGSTPLLVGVGIAKCHPKDNYIKAVGRELAFDDLNNNVADIYNIFIDNKEVILYVKFSTRLGIRFSMQVVLKKTAKTVRIINVDEEYEE